LRLERLHGDTRHDLDPHGLGKPRRFAPEPVAPGAVVGRNEYGTEVLEPLRRLFERRPESVGLVRRRSIHDPIRLVA
jgi:hypothetical protein